MSVDRSPAPPEIRFKRLVLFGPEGACWEWQGTIWGKSMGYGKFRLNTSTQVYAHRFAYELWKGPIPSGLCVCHTCDNPRCVNPNHLWAGTAAENSLDMWAKGRARPMGPRGEASGMAKLTEQQVKEIRELVSSKIPRRRIAASFGVSKSLINAIAWGDAWAWLE